MILQEIRRPNSLKTLPSGVANCRNLPFGGRATRGLTGSSSKKGKCAESPSTFIRGKHPKNRKGVVYEL
ncbi:hypothetical protein HKD37_01G001633 [Glycine soja]